MATFRFPTQVITPHGSQTVQIVDKDGTVLFEADGSDGTVVILGEDMSDVLALVEIIENLPTSDPEDGETVWNDEGVLKVASVSQGG